MAINLLLNSGRAKTPLEAFNLVRDAWASKKLADQFFAIAERQKGNIAKFKEKAEIVKKYLYD